jgi:hypothetical protein
MGNYYIRGMSLKTKRFYGIKRETTAAYTAFDIKCIHKAGFLSITREKGRCTWKNNAGQSKEFIEFKLKIDKNLMVITDMQHMYKPPANQEVHSCIYFKSTTCNYGGKRLWFQCPSCLRRCRVLYFNQMGNFPDTFQCRECLNLAYPSQNLNKNLRYAAQFGKANSSIKKLRSTYYNGRPTKRYERLARIIELGDSNGYFEKMFAKIEKCIDVGKVASKTANNNTGQQKFIDKIPQLR